MTTTAPPEGIGSTPDIGSPLDRSAGPIFTAARILAGLLWLQNSGSTSKLPPDFERFGETLQEGVEHPTLPLFSTLLEEVAIPNLAVFGWFVLLTEIVLAVLLLSGLATRGAALLAAVQSLFIGFTVANVPFEWGWAYWLMISSHLLLFAVAAGRYGGLDGILRPRLAGSSSPIAKIYVRWLS